MEFDISDRLSTIDTEGEDQEQDTFVAESWYEELVGTKPLAEDLTFEDTMLTPVHMMPDQLMQGGPVDAW